MSEMMFSLERYIINDKHTNEVLIKYGMSMDEFEEIEELLAQNDRYSLISKSSESVSLTDLPTDYLDTLLSKTSNNPNNAMVLTEIHRIINSRQDMIK